MFDFGIRGYEPRWLDDVVSVTAAHGRRLASLVGRRLTRSWVVWELNADEWFADAPVLLDFQGEQVELNHQKFHDLSITWNSIGTGETPTWPTDTGDFRLAWRDDAVRGLAVLHGARLESVQLLEWAGGADDIANGATAVHFALTSGSVTVYNALDENGLSFDVPDASWKLHPLR